MTTYDFVHLVLLASDGQIQGRTKLQKTVYFVGALTEMLEGLGYRAHYYGPYSSAVTAAVERLTGAGFLEQHTRSAGSVNDQGFEVARFDYTLTEDGKKVAEEKADEHPDEWTNIKDALQRLQQTNEENYIKLSIAAKVYFLLEKKKTAATTEELLKMSSRFGWKVEEQQMLEAGRLLESIGLIEVD